ncbi:hypothetical protein [Clostridium sp. AM58-1XD]|uniref:hypothetical protein n=1 Tax=Clostridium sp. AM58-1XD TaxID=2292307 RepID=UPI001FA8955E|nr:hypothetical protein [Clostridium sp. AM58-1XD]
MYEIDTKLKELADRGTPISVALVGAGQMGKDIVAQISGMQGMEITVVVDIREGICLEAYRLAGINDGICTTNDVEEAEKAAGNGLKIASTDYKTATRLSKVQVVIDATGSPEMGARISLDCFDHSKHIVMMNVECDITVGPILRRMAEKAGVVYSLTAGDEPGSIIEVYRFAKALALKL